MVDRKALRYSVDDVRASSSPALLAARIYSCRGNNDVKDTWGSKFFRRVRCQWTLDDDNV